MSRFVLLPLLAFAFISAVYSAEDVASATVATDHKTTKIVAHAKKVTDMPVHDIKEVTDAPIGMSTDPSGAEVPTTVIDEATTTTKFQTHDGVPAANATTKHVVRSSGMLLMSISIGTVAFSLL